jgi:hypothetical protein
MYQEDKEKYIMKLKINDERTISAVQADFNRFFPYLKIEFFKAPHQIGEGSAKNLLYDNTRYLKDCRVRHNQGEIELKDSMTVNELEEVFLHQFGLSAQVFRKSGNVWLETSATDNWTLRQQNDEGAELSVQIKKDREDIDYD